MCEMVPQHDHQIENHENSTHEWVAKGTTAVTHFSSKCNVSTFLLKKCAASTIHSCVGLATTSNEFIISNWMSPSQHCPYHCLLCCSINSIQSFSLPGNHCSPFLSRFQCTSSASSCISAASCHILSRLPPPSYLQAIMSDPIGGVLTHALIPVIPY